MTEVQYTFLSLFLGSENGERQIIELLESEPEAEALDGFKVGVDFILMALGKRPIYNSRAIALMKERLGNEAE